MRETGIWFLLSCKRYLKKHTFLLILLLLPVGAFLIRDREKNDQQNILIAVYARRQGEELGQKLAVGQKQEQTASALEQQLASRLIQIHEERENALFQFYLCDSEEQVKNDVAARKAECGFVLSENLRQKLDTHDAKRCIVVYSAPSTVLASLSAEIVAAALMELYDREIFLNYVAETVKEPEAGMEAVPDLTEEQIKREAGQLYDKWLESGAVFRFQYRHYDEEGDLASKESQERDIRIFPVRGMVAVYLFLVGLYSAVMLGMDEEKGLFLPLSGCRLWRRLAELAAPVFLAGLSGAAALYAGGCLADRTREFLGMAAYIMAVCCFSFVMKCICRKPQVLSCMIPFFLVGSLIFSPVLVDISRFFPETAWVSRLFLPTYYLWLAG